MLSANARSGGPSRPENTLLVFGVEEDGERRWKSISYIPYPGEIPADTADTVKKMAELDDHRVSVVGRFVRAVIFEPPLDYDKAVKAAEAISQIPGMDVQGADFVVTPRDDPNQPPVRSIDF